VRVQKGVLHPKQGLLEGLEGVYYNPNRMCLRAWRGVLQPRHAAWGVFNLQDCSEGIKSVEICNTASWLQVATGARMAVTSRERERENIADKTNGGGPG